MRELEAQHQNIIRYNNSKSVIKVIQQNQFDPISRADIAKVLQMSPTSITRIITSLMDLRLIKQEESFSKGVGRNGINIRINRDAFYSLGFAIDSDYLKLSIIDCERCEVTETITRLSGKDYDADKLLQQGYELFLQMCKEKQIAKEHVTCMGISCCGLVDYQAGISSFSPQLGWKNVNIKEKAEAIFHLPVCVDNDIKMALIGATFQSTQLSASDVTYLSIGSGVGAAVMYHGNMIRGINNAAGEIGHTMFSLNGKQCACGKKGCLSAYISEQGAIRQCESRGYHLTEVREMMAAYYAEEQWAKEVVDDLTKDMAITFCNMIYTYNPQYLLVGGNMVVDFPELYEMARTKFLDLVNTDFNLNIVIKKREFKNNEALGAAYTAQEQYIDKLLTT